MKKIIELTPLLLALNVWAGNSPVVCESMTPCRLPRGVIAPYELPTLSFETIADTEVFVTASVWWTTGCPKDPDEVYPSDFFVPPGTYYQVADVGDYPDGTGYSIVWSIDGCPELPCVDGVIGETPDICQ